MKLQYTIKTSLKSLKINAFRSFLTILGIVIGITSIILIQSVGTGAQNLILNQIRGIGSQTIIVEPGREPQGPSDFIELFSDSLKLRDVEALKNPANVQGIKELTPSVMQSLSVAFENETKRVNVLGTSGLFAKILEIYPEKGIFISAEDIDQKARVAVIGSEVKQELFGDSNALGEKIKIKGLSFRVIGVLPAKGQVSLFQIDDLVIVPYTTAQQYLLGINYFHRIIVQAENEEIVPRVVKSMEQTLRELHTIDDPEKDDFHIHTQADIAARVSTVTDILTILLISVAAVSLVVGGIGIMNIMLVAVTERTREIGLRKALGATDRDILSQFLFEALLLTFLGGLIGVLLGALLSFITSLILTKIVSFGWEFTFPISAALLGLGVSTCVGLVFGLYPAKKASAKSPIEALRYE